MKCMLPTLVLLLFTLSGVAGCSSHSDPPKSKPEDEKNAPQASGDKSKNQETDTIRIIATGTVGMHVAGFAQDGYCCLVFPETKYNTDTFILAQETAEERDIRLPVVADPKLKALLGKPVAVTGELSNHQWITYSSFVPIDDNNKNVYPPMGCMQLEGKAVAGEYDISRTEKADLALLAWPRGLTLKNGPPTTAVALLPAVPNLSLSEGQLRVVGRYRQINRNLGATVGLMALDVDKVEPVTKKK